MSEPQANEYRKFVPSDQLNKYLLSIPESNNTRTLNPTGAALGHLFVLQPKARIF